MGERVFRAFKIRLELFLSEDFGNDFSVDDIRSSLEVDYTFGSVLKLKLDFSFSCSAGSLEELEGCLAAKNAES